MQKGTDRLFSPIIRIVINRFWLSFQRIHLQRKIASHHSHRDDRLRRGFLLSSCWRLASHINSEKRSRFIPATIDLSLSSFYKSQTASVTVVGPPYWSPLWSIQKMSVLSFFLSLPYLTYFTLHETQGIQIPATIVPPPLVSECWRFRRSGCSSWFFYMMRKRFV